MLEDRAFHTWRSTALLVVGEGATSEGRGADAMLRLRPGTVSTGTPFSTTAAHKQYELHAALTVRRYLVALSPGLAGKPTTAQHASSGRDRYQEESQRGGCSRSGACWMEGRVIAKDQHDFVSSCSMHSNTRQSKRHSCLALNSVWRCVLVSLFANLSPPSLRWLKIWCVQLRTSDGAVRIEDQPCALVLCLGGINGRVRRLDGCDL